MTRDWTDGILLAGVVVFLIALLSLTVVHTAVGWLRQIKKPLETSQRRDPVIAVDQWTAERRAGLARLNQPAAKGFDARRKQLLQAVKTGGPK